MDAAFTFSNAPVETQEQAQQVLKDLRATDQDAYEAALWPGNEGVASWRWQRFLEAKAVLASVTAAGG